MFLALDQGTTSSRSILFSEEGAILACAQEEFPQCFPQPAWVEHDLERIWQSQLATARRVLSESGMNASDVRAIGIANQRETAAIWDRKTGKPLGPAIVWQDRRTSERCDQLKQEGREAEIYAKTGLVVDAYFSATKFEWMLKNLNGLEREDVCLGTIDSYLIFRLTGGRVHATDVTNASRTMLFNIQSLQWDAELLDLFGIPVELLPKVQPSNAFYGETSAEWFGSTIPIQGVIGDQQASTFGQGCIEPGMVKNTYGTGSFLLANVGSQPLPSKHRLLSTVAWQEDQNTTYALEGSVFVAGSAVQWLRDGLGIISSSAEIEKLALSVRDADGVYFVPAFVGLGAPYWDSDARGLLCGITRGTTKAHIARATLEAVCLQTLDVVDAMQEDCPIPLRELRVDGGMTRNGLLMQMQADILNMPIRRASLAETTAFGAARMAGLRAEMSFDTVFEPQKTPAWREAKKEGWREAVARARN